MRKKCLAMLLTTVFLLMDISSVYASSDGDILSGDDEVSFISADDELVGGDEVSISSMDEELHEGDVITDSSEMEELVTEDVLASENIDEANEDNVAVIEDGDSNNNEVTATIDLSDVIIQLGGFPKPQKVDNKKGEIQPDKVSDESNSYNAASDYVVKELLKWDGKSEKIQVNVTSFGISTYDIKSFHQTMCDLHPELFFLTGRISYSYNPSTNNITTIDYLVNNSYSKEDIVKFNEAVETILEGIDSDWTDIQKLIYVHDYLVMHINYDETYSNFNAYNALVDGSCVCQGYALAYEYLLDQIDESFDCQVISSATMAHAWNMVTLNERKYYVDVTWDDPIRTYEFYDSYDNLLISRGKLIENKHEGNDWVDTSGNSVYEMVTADTYDNAVWKGMSSSMPMFGKKGVYYTGYKPMKVYIYSFIDSESEEIFSTSKVLPLSRTFLI